MPTEDARIQTYFLKTFKEFRKVYHTILITMYSDIQNELHLIKFHLNLQN